MAKGNTSKTNVVVKPQAFVDLTLHAVRHKHDSVHGVLLGSSAENLVTVTSAVAVSHGAPTRPLVETALGLLPTEDIIGWYTAPSLLEDTKPGPVALRMAANLAADGRGEPTLIVIQNAALTTAFKGEGKADDVLKAFGKDLGQQWIEPLGLSVESASDALKQAKDSVAKGEELNDFVDHLEGDGFLPWNIRK